MKNDAKSRAIRGAILRAVHERRSRSGSALVLFVFAFVMVLGLSALAIDFGWAYLEETRLQRALNAAATAAAEKLYDGGTVASARTAGINFAEANGIHLLEADVEIDSLLNNSHMVTVSKLRPVGLFFAPLLGVSELKTYYKVHALANDSRTLLFSDPLEEESASGIIPLGVPHAQLIGVLQGTIVTASQFEAGIFNDPGRRWTRGERVVLKVGQDFKTKSIAATTQGSSNQGALDLAGTQGGAARYESHFKYGYGERVVIGDLLDAKTGTMVGPTSNANEFRFDQDPNAVLHDDANHVMPLSARMVVLPIVKAHADGPNDMGTGIENLRNIPYMHEGNLKVQVIGFAKFLLDDYSSSMGNGVVTGLFVNYVGTAPSGQDPG